MSFEIVSEYIKEDLPSPIPGSWILASPKINSKAFEFICGELWRDDILQVYFSFTGVHSDYLGNIEVHYVQLRQWKIFEVWHRFEYYLEYSSGY